MSTNPELARAVVALSLAFVLWYFAGVRLNRRLAGSALRWLRLLWPGAGKGRVQWLSHGHVEVAWEEGPGPLARLGASVLLVPREGLLTWPVQLLRGRRDVIVLRGQLRVPPGEDCSRQAPGAIREVELRRSGQVNLAASLDLKEALQRPADEVMRDLIRFVEGEAKKGVATGA